MATVNEQGIVINIPATGGPASVKLPGRDGTVHISPSKLGSILANVQDRTQVAEWHDYLNSHGIATLRKDGGHLVQVLSLPRMTRRIPFSITDDHDAHELVVQYPPMLVIHTWRNGKYVIDNSRMFVSQTRVGSITDPTLLYTFPWGNVRHPTGTPCWGSVPTTALSPADPTGALDVFFRAPFNNHIMAHNLRGELDPQRDYDEDSDYDDNEDDVTHPGLGTRFLHWAQGQPSYPGTMSDPIVLPFPVAHARYRGAAQTVAQALVAIHA